jgi:hypothetical protein
LPENLIEGDFMTTGLPAWRGLTVFAIVVLAACTSTVTDYGLNDHFSGTEASTGSTSTPEQCAQTHDAVWVQGPTYKECIRYFPSPAFVGAHVDRAVVFMEGDVLSTDGSDPNYSRITPEKLINLSSTEQTRDNGLAYVIVGRPGTDGSSGNQNKRRTHYETLVMNAAIDAIKARYGIRQFGLIGQSGGGGLVGALIAERQDVLCAVSSSGVTAVKYRQEEKGKTADVTGTSFADVSDPIDQIPRVHPMEGFRMFVTSDGQDTDVDFGSQDHYVQAAKTAGLAVSQIMVHGSGKSHHQTWKVGNRVMQACMAGLSTNAIVKQFNGMENDGGGMNHVAREIRQEAGNKAVSESKPR